MVGDRHRIHAVLLALGDQVIKSDRAVKQAVLGMDMEVDEIGFFCVGH